MNKTATWVLVGIAVLFISGCDQKYYEFDSIIRSPYLLNTDLITRSISPENPTGVQGEGGKAVHPVWGAGRKGSPFKLIEPGQEIQLCNIDGPGTIRHIWMTTSQRPAVLRGFVIRAWYDGQEHPSIECPVGDFMGFAHGKPVAYHSAVHSCGSMAGMNLWLPMPFVENVKITMENQSEFSAGLYWQIDYTLNDKLPKDVGRLHALFRRENPTTLKEDFELLPERHGKGRYIGAMIGVRNLHPDLWWGEGEVKIYLDGDTEFPTICGTGSEDYVGLSFGIQETPFLYNGGILNQDNFFSMYRWHLPDPIYWKNNCRVTIQQLGSKGETSDDWSTATFWYEPIPSEALPKMPDYNARTQDIWNKKDWAL